MSQQCCHLTAEVGNTAAFSRMNLRSQAPGRDRGAGRRRCLPAATPSPAQPARQCPWMMITGTRLSVEASRHGYAACMDAIRSMICKVGPARARTGRRSATWGSRGCGRRPACWSACRFPPPARSSPPAAMLGPISSCLSERVCNALCIYRLTRRFPALDFVTIWV